MKNATYAKEQCSIGLDDILHLEWIFEEKFTENNHCLIFHIKSFSLGDNLLLHRDVNGFAIQSFLPD